MGLTVSRKTAKNLAVRRKIAKCQSLVVKKVNRKIFLSTICHFESVKILDFYVSCLKASAVATVAHSILVPKTDIWLRFGRVIFREPEVSAFRAWIELTDSPLFKLFLGSSVFSFSV